MNKTADLKQKISQFTVCNTLDVPRFVASNNSRALKVVNDHGKIKFGYVLVENVVKICATLDKLASFSLYLRHHVMFSSC